MSKQTLIYTEFGDTSMVKINSNFDELYSEKEDVVNKSTSVTTDQASDTKYPSVKSVYDWATTTLSKYLGDADFYQYSIVRTVDSGNLTVALKNYEGNDPTATKPVKIMIGGVVRTISSAISVVKADGTNWCNAGSAELATKEIDYFTYLGYNASNGVVICFSRIPTATLYDDFSGTSTNEKFLMKSVVLTGGDPVVNIGRFNATLSAGAGYTWSIPATSVIVNRPIYETRRLSITVTPTWNGTAPTTINTSGYFYQVIGNRVELQYFVIYTNAGVTNTQVGFPLPFSVSSGQRNVINGLVSTSSNTPNLTLGTMNVLDLTNVYLNCTSISANRAVISGSYFAL